MKFLIRNADHSILACSPPLIQQNGNIHHLRYSSRDPMKCLNMVESICTRSYVVVDVLRVPSFQPPDGSIVLCYLFLLLAQANAGKW